MKPRLQTLLVVLTTLMTASPPDLAALPPVIPKHKVTQVLVTGKDTPEAPYPAFPALLHLGGEVLVSFKHGRAHAADPGAVLDLMRLDAATGKVRSHAPLARIDGKIMQMGEWVRFANGDIANWIDAQQKEVPTRIGLRAVYSRDGGKTFGPPERVGAVDGVEYGYAFEAITRDQTTWMLVMTFGNLTGGKIIHTARSLPGSVDVIRTDDNGRTWRFVRSITEELGGAPINESSFAAHGDGFMVTARGYDKRQWLLVTDGDFKLKRKLDLTASHPFIESHIGRPRVFTRDGGWYLLGRNVMGPNAEAGAAPNNKCNPMRLSLFKFDPDTLLVTKHVVLDNAEAADVIDGYYAAPWWHERGGRTYLNTVTYKRLAGLMPDIIRLEFDWEEVR